MDYKATLNLPKTNFPMKADLPRTEPECLKRWEGQGLYRLIEGSGRDRPKYILHDGPPYANGHIHIGHALNKILKDFIVKAKYMSGYSTDFVPGWDCHGLPIELQVEKDLGVEKYKLSPIEIRKRCRAYAERFMNIQREEFKRLGVFGEWGKPYRTMDYSYQASIVRELGKFVSLGLVYKSKRPIHWCGSCQTALAEAEVEYYERESPSIYVKFKIQDSRLKTQDSRLQTYIVIWTTTPWTLPANLAIAVHPDVAYSEVKIDGQGEVWVIADTLVEQCMVKFGLQGRYSIIGRYKGRDLEGVVCQHPFIDRASKVIVGEHVMTETGTGCVHTAPGHGQEDYEIGLKYGLDIYSPVDNQGRFTSKVPAFAGQNVFKANAGIIELLRQRDALLLEERITHSYPHCWRCKNPVIFRATEQWFISMEKGDLRKKALAEIDRVRWIPSWGRDRIYNMVLNRPDWCISRQRAWGVPIVAFYCKGCSRILLYERVINYIADLFEKEGADIWFERGPEEFLPKGTLCPECNEEEFEKETDILDVWFDSGVSFAGVLEKRAGLKMPADLYLEGSDQHRGWFHSSLLASVGTRGISPYRTVLTHGFVVDGEGRKMSKSLGNVIAPQDVIDRYGAEILRLWVSAEDYREDIRISDEILTRLADAYRRIRNTCRYILGNLYDFNPERDVISYGELTELDRFIIHKIVRLTEKVLAAHESFEFHIIYHSIHNFCNVDLSAFYLDIIKDRLYVSRANSVTRRAAQTTIYYVLDYIVRLMAPILPFTMDEVWRHMVKGDLQREESVHLASFPVVKKEWLDDGLEERWVALLRVKVEVAKALESARKEKVIGHSLDARVAIIPPDGFMAFLKGYEDTLREILIVSRLDVEDARNLEGKVEGEGFIAFESQEVASLKVWVSHAEGKKCERCWHYSEDVGMNTEYPMVCGRCVSVVSSQ